MTLPSTKTTVIPPVRCTVAELARIKVLAAKAKQTMSEYVRTRCLVLETRRPQAFPPRALKRSRAGGV
jgi:hypothetical protein